MNCELKVAATFSNSKAGKQRNRIAKIFLSGFGSCRILRLEHGPVLRLTDRNPPNFVDKFYAPLEWFCRTDTALASWILLWVKFWTPMPPEVTIENRPSN